MAKVSVIIPFYNEQKHIEECLLSVVNQTLKEIEIILVNDGSTDGSVKAIEHIVLTDVRIKLVYQKNGGLGPARNHGLSIATGEYVAFIDSDDFIALDMMEEMYMDAMRNNADIVMCRHQRVSNEGDLLDEVSREITPHTKEGFFRTIIAIDYVSLSVDKLYRRRLFEKVPERFPSMYYEDLSLVFNLFYNADTISFVNEPYYFWRKKVGSITRSISSKHIHDIFEALDITYRFLIKKQIYEDYKIEFTKRCALYIGTMLDRVKAYATDNGSELLGMIRSYEEKRGYVTVEKLLLLKEVYSQSLRDYLSSYIRNNDLLCLDYEWLTFIFDFDHKLFEWCIGTAIRIKQPLVLETAVLDLIRLHDSHIFEWYIGAAIENSHLDSNTIEFFRQKIEFNDYLTLVDMQEKQKKFDDLERLKDSFKGQKCIILGEGPSFANFDKTLLEGHCTFGFGTILSKYTPMIYVNDNPRLIYKNLRQIDEAISLYKFVPSYCDNLFSSRTTIMRMNVNHSYKRFSDKNYGVPIFSKEITECVNIGETTVHTCLQIAYFMGFSEVYLLGIDMHYDQKKRTLYRDTTDENVQKICQEFELAKKVFEEDGRKIINLSKQSILGMFEVEEFTTFADVISAKGYE